MSYRIYTFLLFAFLLMPTDYLSSQSETKDWTLMVYIVGSDLESGSSAASTDIAEMIAGASSTEYVNVLVMTGGANKPGWETIRTFIIEDGVQTELDFHPSSDDMSNPNNLTEFINWGTENYPAQSYMLDLWNHGGELRGYGWVDGTEDHLSINQIQNAIGQSAFIANNNKFDLIGFDACLMANLEIQSTLQDYGFFFVGSEETEPGHGWNYKPIIEAMEGGQALYGDQLGMIIVDSYEQHAIDEGTINTGVTLSLTNLGNISNVEEKLQALLTSIQNSNKEGALQQAISASEEYGKSAQYPSGSSDVVDLYDLAQNLASLDNSLATECNNLLAALDTAIIHFINDGARPKANGMTTYFPHNVFGNSGELDYVIESVYTPLNIPSYLKNFVLNDYIPFVNEDNGVSGAMTVNGPESTESGFSNADALVTLTVEHDSDIEHVQIVLDEEFAGNPNEYILLGSTFPDSITNIDEETDQYHYFWDEQWLGLNGFPAYISDIHDYTLEDEEGVLRTFHRIHIPAVLNVGSSEEKNIIMSYRFDEEFNIVMEGITHEHNGSEASRLVPKERIILQPGDEVQLVYEVFNEVSDEEFFYQKPGAVIEIVNGNEDLQLEYDQLEPGNYQIGFVILDHSHNDTIIFVDEVFEVLPNKVVESFSAAGLVMYPNPVDAGFTISDPSQRIAADTKIYITDVNGVVILEQALQLNSVVNTQFIPSGVYTVSIQSGNELYTDKLIIQH